MIDKIRQHACFPAVLLLLLFTFLIGGSKSVAEAAKKKPRTKTQEKAPVKKANFKIIAYYFHGTSRCVTCRKLEAFADEAIKKGFPNELKDGSVEWRVVNVEEKGNEHFIEDFKLYSKSLVLVEMDGNKQVKWKNLEKIWELVKNEDAYIQYVQDEVKQYLGDAPRKPEKTKIKTESK